MGTGRHGSKWVHWCQMGYISSKYSCLYFILQRYFFSVCFFKKEDNFFFIPAIIHIIGTIIFSRINVGYVFLVRTLTRNFAFLEMLFQYLLTVLIRSKFRTLLNMMALFVRIGTVIMPLISL